MFVAKLDKAEPLKKLVNILMDIVSTIEWRINSDGIHIHTMNTSHTCVVDVNIPVSAFKSFSCEEESVVINIPLVNLSKVIKCIANDQSIFINVETNDEMLLYFHDKADNAREFRLSLLSLDDDGNTMLELPGKETYMLEKEVDAEEFNTLIKEFASIGDFIKIETVEKNLKFSTDGDIGCASILFKSSQTVEAGVQLGTFATRYLISMTKTSSATKENTNVSIYLSNEKPIMLKYDIMYGFGTMLFFLAPKMEC
jgi:proliferating cell nuclear antigen